MSQEARCRHAEPKQVAWPRAAARSTVDWQPDASEFLADPHSYWHRLRARAPVAWSDYLSAWLVTGHAAARAVLEQPDFATDVYGRYGPSPIPLPSSFQLAREDNRSFRRRVGVLLAEHDDLEAGVADACRRVCDGLPDPGFDLVVDYAEPLAAELVSRWLGLSAHQRDYLVALLDVAAEEVDPVRRAAAGQLFVDWLMAELAERRAAPGVDALSRLAVGWRRLGGRDEDLVAFLSPMVYSLVQRNGARLTAHAAYGLTMMPDLQRQVRAGGRVTARRAADEAARWAPVNPVVPRRAIRAVDLFGQEILADETVFVVMPAVCRDPAAHPVPDAFRLDRNESHIAFGAGWHGCIGRGVALQVAAISLVVLLEAGGLWRQAGQPRVEVIFGPTYLGLPVRADR